MYKSIVFDVVRFKGVYIYTVKQQRYQILHGLERQTTQWALGASSPQSPEGQETFKAHKLKIARAGCPKGCDEFYCAINDEIFPYCATYTDGQLNAVETYRKYYATKTWALKWNHSCDAPPAWYLEAFQQKELMDNLWI